MFFILKRRQIVAAAAVLVLTVCLVSLFFSADLAAPLSGKNKKLPVYGVSTDKKAVALTFDAAWGADKTAGIIKTLNDFGADATFFLVGFWIDAYPAETLAIRENGFEIGNHSNNHLQMSKLDALKIEEEIVSVNERIIELTGCTPKFFRPPFGDYNNRLIEGVESLGMIAVQWSVDSLDWKGLSGSQIAARVLPKVKNGSIILFHNNSDHILEALPLVLTALKGQGYEFVKLSDLVYTQNYVIEADGTQKLNKV